MSEEEENLNKSKGRVCTTPELEKDYTRLVGCRRSREWKPKLETIKEKEKKKHRSFGMKRKEKGQSPSKGKGTHKSQKQEKQVGVNLQTTKLGGGKGL